MLQKSKLILALAALGCFFIGIALYINFFPRQPAGTAHSPAQPSIPATVIGMQRPEFNLLDLNDQPRTIQDYHGRIIVLNFWATWCPPCVREIPALIALQEKYRDRGVEVVGVALDSKQPVIDFVDPMGINYPVLLAEYEGIGLTQAYGNHLGALPYTVIIDREGTIRHTMLREITLDEAEKLIQPLL